MKTALYFKAPTVRVVTYTNTFTSLVENGLLKTFLQSLPKNSLHFTIKSRQNELFHTDRLLSTNGYQLWSSYERLKERIDIQQAGMPVASRLLEEISKSEEEVIVFAKEGIQINSEQVYESVSRFENKRLEAAVIDGYELALKKGKDARASLSKLEHWLQTMLGNLEASTYAPTTIMISKKHLQQLLIDAGHSSIRVAV